jgi:hypothetical protein
MTVRNSAIKAKVDTGPDGDEEQPQQQPLERLDIGFQFVAKLRVGQNDARQEGSQSGREANQGH